MTQHEEIEKKCPKREFATKLDMMSRLVLLGSTRRGDTDDKIM